MKYSEIEDKKLKPYIINNVLSFNYFSLKDEYFIEIYKIDRIENLGFYSFYQNMDGNIVFITDDYGIQRIPIFYLSDALNQYYRMTSTNLPFQKFTDIHHNRYDVYIYGQLYKQNLTNYETIEIENVVKNYIT